MIRSTKQTDKLLQELSAKRKEKGSFIKYQKDIVAELVQKQHKKEVGK